MDEREYIYEINGRSYVQRPLVLGQIGQINDVLKGVEITGDMGIEQIVQLLGDRLPVAMAIVLTEKHTRMQDKDPQVLAEEMREFMDIGTAMEVIDHFLSLNPIASIFGRLTGIMAGITKAKIGSKTSLSPSPEETSQSEREFSGDSP
ncbi:MAG: hypothetical protein GXX82_16545 [Syntrophorhabdus sp.]|nr:hypothetical protein [Syntrophorhabdus sp.]